MITKRTEHGAITILPDGQVQLRTDTILVEEDGVELSRQYHRVVLEPSADLPADADPRLAAILRAAWTPAVVAAFAAAKAERLARDPILGGVLNG